MLIFYLTNLISGGSGRAAAVASAGGEYVQTSGKGKRKRYFVELDGKRTWGTRRELEALLQDRRPNPPAEPALAALQAQTADVARSPAKPWPAPASDPALLARARETADTIIAARLTEQQAIDAAEKERLRRLLDDEEAILALMFA